MESSKDFYARLPVLDSFEAAITSGIHADVPDDWWIVVTDVKGSTAAIAEGQYKHVNTVGVTGLIALRNIDRSLNLPFVFGGDGAIMAIPPDIKDKALRVLAGVRRVSREAFQLDLRAGMVQVRTLRQAGHWCRISKYRLSPYIDHAIISGRGWDFAEHLLKTGAIDIPYEGASLDEVDFSGFECRWRNVPSRRDCKLCIVVVSLESQLEDRAAAYKDLVQSIGRVIGSVDGHHPVTDQGLSLSLSPRSMWNEVAVRSRGRLARLKYYFYLIFIAFAGKLLFRFGIYTKAVRWSQYRKDFVANADFKKFDGALKMIIDASNEQVAELERLLQSLFVEGQVCYGLHRSKEAIVTCMIEDYNEKHTHFVDGSDGGYAAAAKMMKEQLSARHSMMSEKKRA